MIGTRTSFVLLAVCSALAIGSWVMPSTLAAQKQKERIPVMIGGEPGLDACGSIGVVSGLKPVPGNTVAVRSGPGLDYASLGALPFGARVYLCDRKDQWVGVVYGSDCGVSTPAATRQAYAGPCASGWVYQQYITLLAG